MVLVEIVFGIGDDITLHGRLSVYFAERIEFEHVALHAFCTLHAPSQLEVGGEHGLGGFAVDAGVDGSGIGCYTVTYDASVGRHALQLHEFGEQRVLVGGLLCGLGLCFGGVGGGGVGGCVSFGQTAIQRLQGRINFVQCVCFPKFEVGRTLEQFTYALRLLDARHFDHDLANLSFASEDLDVRLGHAKAVDTRAYHLVGVFHGSVDLFGEHFLHLVVA